LFIRTLYEGLASLVVGLIPKLAGALFVFLLFYLIYRVLRTLLRRLLRRSRNIDSGLENLLMQTFRLSALSLIAVMVLSQLGVNVAALLAGLGIAGIALGFAARDTLENFISGITILIDRPFRIGDNIIVEGTFGTVEEITLRSTRIRTLNNEMMVMPNTHMINQKLINHTMLNVLRVEVPFGIAYKEYPAQARQVVLALTTDDDRLHPDYPPQVVVTSLNDSSVDMRLRVYLNNPKLEVPVRLEYTEKIREALREADIEIPFPHLQLFVDEAKAFENTALLKQVPPASNEDTEPPDSST
jgi:small conductance mechanosensitive channel